MGKSYTVDIRKEFLGRHLQVLCYHCIESRAETSTIESLGEQKNT